MVLVELVVAEGWYPFCCCVVERGLRVSGSWGEVGRCGFVQICDRGCVLRR